MIWEGTSKSDWAATTYTYYPDGTLKSIVGGVSRDSNGVVTTQSIYYDESGYPKTIEYVRANKPNEHETWSLSYTFSDSGSITTFVCSIQDYGETEATTGSFDFGNYDGFISIEIAPVNSYLISPVRLTFTNSDRTYAEMHFLNYSSYFKSFSIRKDTEITTEYDSNGNIASKTTFYPVSDRKITTYYSYDNYENLIEELSPADENTDKKTYTTTYTYGYIYAPDAQ